MTHFIPVLGLDGFLSCSSGIIPGATSEAKLPVLHEEPFAKDGQDDGSTDLLRSRQD
jgi:hypothetical protein